MRGSMAKPKKRKEASLNRKPKRDSRFFINLLSLSSFSSLLFFFVRLYIESILQDQIRVIGDRLYYRVLVLLFQDIWTGFLFLGLLFLGAIYFKKKVRFLKKIPAFIIALTFFVAFLASVFLVDFVDIYTERKPQLGVANLDSGQIISKQSETQFEITITRNQLELDSVMIQIYSPTGTIVLNRNETNAAYCVFGGDGPCDPWDKNASIPWEAVENGQYRLVFWGYMLNNDIVELREILFVIDKE